MSKIGDEAEEEVFLMICAFCLRTSAGVRIRQETASAREEDVAWRRGVGMMGDGLGLIEVGEEKWVLRR